MSRSRIVTSQSVKNQNSLFKIQILIVDHDSISLALISSMLKTCSLQDNLIELSLITVKNGIDALSTIKAKDDKFDLVLIDLHLPEMNGWELQKQIDENFKIPVIIMSLDDRESVIAKSIESGARLHVVKPVNQQDLKNILKCAVATKKSKAVVVDKETMRRNNNNNNNNEEEIASSNEQEVSSASSVNEESSNKKKQKGKKRIRDDQENEEPIAPKKAKVVWTNSLHNRFLQAINHIGLEKAVPKRILEFMNVPGLTRENVASHLQKYRMFLKKVAERGLWSSQAMSERILRSSFATGYNSSLMHKNSLQFPQQPLNTFQPGYGGNFSSASNSSCGLSRYPYHEASTSNSAPQFRLGQSSLLGGQTNFQRPMFSDTSPYYQRNQTRYGMQMQPTNVINGLTTPTTPMSMYQQQNQSAGSNFQNFGNPSPYFQLGSSGNHASANGINMGTTNNFFPPFNPNSNYAGIRLNSNGELGTGQMRPVGTDLSTNSNLGYGSMNWTNHTSKDNANNGFIGNPMPSYVPNQGGFSSPPTFGEYLGQGGSSSSSTLFGTANQISMPFNVENNESTSILTPLSQQNTNVCLENSGGNDLAFNFINDVSNPGGTSHNQEELEDCDLELFFGSTNSTTPYQQGVEGAATIDSSYQPELNTNEFLNVEFSNSCSIVDKAPWSDHSSQQIQSAEEIVNANFDSTGNSMGSYFPSFDQTQRSPEEPMDSELNEMHQEIGTSDENQVWGDDFLDILLGNNPY